jgi:ribonucleoside-triphosphate reductase (formate)
MGQDGFTINLSYEEDFVTLLSTLKAKYPSGLFSIQGISNNNLDINQFSKSFFKKSASLNVANVSADPNSNVTGMYIDQWTYEFGKGIQKLNSIYLAWDSLRKIYGLDEANDIIESVMNGSIFINDLHQFDRPYCFGFDLAPLCMDGLKFFDRLNIGPPKRADSFIDLVIQSTAYLSNQIAGATSFPTLFVNLDWYLRNDYGENYAVAISDSSNPISVKLKNLFQKLIYSWGWPFRGSQSPFTNVSILDRGFLNALFGIDENGAQKYVNPDGTSPNLDSIYILQKQFYEYFDKIFATEQIFTFPIITLAASLNPDRTYIDPEFIDWISKVYANKCVANIYIGEPNSFSSCCRMKNDFEKIGKREYQNSFGVGGVSVGSTRVVGVNLPRIAFQMKNSNLPDYKEILAIELEKCHKVLYAHRELLKDRIARGSLPLYKAGWITLAKQFNTLGFIGAYEFLDILEKDVVSDEGSDYLVDVMKQLECSVNAWETEDDVSFNVEQIPGESMAVRLSQLDKLLGYNKDYEVELYSNQYVPLIKKASISDRFKIQGKFDNLTSGGSILHLNIHDGARMTPAQVYKLLESARLSKTVYFAINRVFCKCEEGHYAISNNGSCPECGAKIKTQYTRVVGFCVPVDSWHHARQDEFHERVFYSDNSLMAFN